MLSSVASGSLQGVQAQHVEIEVSTGEKGDPRVVMVGLPDTAVKESLDRVAAAISNSGYKMPGTRTTINLAPGDLRKEGPFYDLPIALGLLLSTKQLKCDHISDYLIVGELGLSGELRPIRGALAMAILARSLGKKGLLVPPSSAEEAVLVDGIDVFPIKSLDDAVHYLEGKEDLPKLDRESSAFTQSPTDAQAIDFSEVKGQQALRRAVEIAVAGGHNLLMIGPPGSGKSMIAKRIPSIMPEPSYDEFIEILSIQSAAGMSLKEEHRCFKRPFRSPHHTISDIGLLGGGSIPGPGEISLAHNGILFLDELPEFKRSALEVMRQPLEDGQVTISRSAGKITLPSAFMLISAMNPCPCGYLGDSQNECRCSQTQIQRYRSRISGPLLDRIDIHVEAPATQLASLSDDTPAEPSNAIRERVQKARDLQIRRFSKETNHSNAKMEHKAIRKWCQLEANSQQLLKQAMDQLKLSARAYDRILKVSRTIADLDHSDSIQEKHLLEAIQYRSLDRQVFY